MTTMMRFKRCLIALACALTCFSFGSRGQSALPNNVSPSITPESAFVSHLKYVNAYFGFLLTLPNDPALREFNLSTKDSSRHVLLALEEQKFKTGVFGGKPQLTAFVVLARHVVHASSDDARHAAAGPNGRTIKPIKIGGKKFWESQTSAKGPGGKMRQTIIAGSLNDYVLQFQIDSFDEKLAKQLESCVLAISFFEPSEAEKIAGPNSRPYRISSPATAAPLPPGLAGHQVRADVPLRFLGELGRDVQTLQAMTSEEFEAIRERATNGDEKAETFLCLAYRGGLRVQKDEAEALTWCQKGSDQGSAEAMEELGMIYSDSTSRYFDSAKAISWLTKAAALGFASAMDNLGTFYANGVGASKNYDKALRWYQDSSKAGFLPADYDLGIVYMLGQGVPVDVPQAMNFFRKAANAGWAYPMFVLGSIYESGFSNIEPDRKTAKDWFKKGADLGEVHCQGELGWIYANGIGAQRDYAEAVKWYRAAADQGDPVGAYGLGVRYLEGQGITRDVSQAMYWFGKAADAGHADAAYDLGAILANQIPGRPGPPDFASAAKYLAIAANQDVSDAQCMLGLLYAHGYGVPQDDITAYQWILLSQRGSHACDQDEVHLCARMTQSQLQEARRRAADFKPAPSAINYGRSVPAKGTQMRSN
jgi:TPR repeat protein